MIEADQATEPPPSDADKDAAPPAPANPGKTVPPEGQHRSQISDESPLPSATESLLFHPFLLVLEYTKFQTS